MSTHNPSAGAVALASCLSLAMPFVFPCQSALAQVFSDHGDVRYAQNYQEPLEGETSQNYKTASKPDKSRDMTPYEKQEEAIQQSRAMYGAPERMPNRQPAQPLEQAYQQQDPYYNQTYNGYVSKPSKIKSALGTAGRLLGTTAAVAVPVTSIVLMSRMARNNNMNMRSGGSFGGNGFNGGGFNGTGFNRISGF